MIRDGLLPFSVKSLLFSSNWRSLNTEMSMEIEPRHLHAIQEESCCFPGEVTLETELCCVGERHLNARVSG